MCCRSTIFIERAEVFKALNERASSLFQNEEIGVSPTPLVSMLCFCCIYTLATAAICGMEQSWLTLSSKKKNFIKALNLNMLFDRLSLVIAVQERDLLSRTGLLISSPA